MFSESAIDVTFDFRTDSNGRDPDAFSPTLKRYHQLLWSKPLPDGRPFDLTTDTQYVYLHHQSDAGEFTLSSDSVIPTWDYWKVPPAYLAQVPKDVLDEFIRVSYTIGGMMLFPSNPVDRKHTINQARGMKKDAIGDRFDLTLECIRRYYLDPSSESPLADTLARYPEFFALFGDFRGYVDFFLLQDLVTDDYSAVRFFTDFHDFSTPAVPLTLEEFDVYRVRSIEFVEARNQRISRA